jgi:polysaccharide deacetylase family protein (PEP-CTERM system associated)
MSGAEGVPHFFTVDVEESFQVSALEPFVSRSHWTSFESRVAGNVDRLLDLLAGTGTEATFFVLGWVAERAPEMVRAIVSRGHEVASHGWDHRRVTDQTPDQFRESVRGSKRLLEDLAGAPVLGFRAPSFSIVPGREWALDILLEEGYRYDSSLLPVQRRGSGYPGTAPDPHVVARPAGALMEFPPATFRVGARLLAAGGGAYLRLLPFALVRGALRQATRRGVPATLYTHPWEIDPAQPRIPVPPLTRIRHYGGLRRTHGRLARLLREFRFQAIRRAVTLSEPVGA